MDRDYITITKNQLITPQIIKIPLNKTFLRLYSLMSVIKDAKKCFFDNLIIDGVIFLPVPNFMILNVLTARVVERIVQ